ncbi:MAG: SDR family oxidoreductase [Chloroflexota bacterium]
MNTLNNKNVLVFAATGAIASSAARKFASEGATVYLSGLDKTRLQALADDIHAMGGKVHISEVDATDPVAVADYVADVAEEAGTIHGVFNGIGGRPSALGYPEVSATTSLDHFMLPFEQIVASQFLTARETAKYMTAGGGIVFLSASLSRMTAPFMAGISAAQGAIEALTRSLAGEYGMQGIRVNCVRGSGMPETRTIQETGAGIVALGGEPKMDLPPLGRPITVADTVNAVSFLVSEESGGMTGQVVTVCAGAFV